MATALIQLRSSSECTNFAEQAEAQGNPRLAAQAHRRAVTLLSQEYGATSVAERAIMEALHEYERALRTQGGSHSGYVRRMLRQSGIVGAIDRLVGKEQTSTGYDRVLVSGKSAAYVLRDEGVQS